MRRFPLIMIMSVFACTLLAEVSQNDSLNAASALPDTLIERKSVKLQSDTTIADDDWESRHADDYKRWREHRSRLRSSHYSHSRGVFRGGAGGWDLFILPLDVAAIGAELQGIGLPDFDEYMLLTGGGGWGFVGRNMRIGGYGAAGYVISNSQPGDIAKEAVFRLRIGGFLVEKAFNPFNRAEIYFGTMIGGGSAELQLSQVSGPVTWDDIWTAFEPDDDETALAYHDYRNKLRTGFFVLLPTLGVRYNIFPWCGIGANVGYLYTYMSQDGWKMNGRTVNGTPDIDCSNLIYRINIYFGG